MSVLITLTDVEPAVRLNAALEQSGIDTEVVSPLDDVRATIRRTKPTVVVLTGGLLDPANVAVVRELLWQDVAVIGFADVRDPAIDERLRLVGYVEVFGKPVVIDEASAGVRRILERQRLARETGLIGESEAIREVLVKVEQIAPVSSTVLIEGESGTGKELIARAIHQLSPRRNKPFIAVNVGALPETLLESELFGHEKGAFTGAAERRLGRFELAHGGTIFLDEIGEIPPNVQVKLLRVLEQREVTRVGGTATIPVDVRVVAATNSPLREAVEQGAFRADLYYRLNVLQIYLPPLRERRGDIPILVRRFVRELSQLHDRQFHGISAEAMQRLIDYPWPGNVRELRNLVESMVVLAPGREIGPADIPPQIRDGGSRLLPVPIGPVVRAHAGAEGRELEFIVRSLLELKLQVEELRRRMDEASQPIGGPGAHFPHLSGPHGSAATLAGQVAGQWIGDVRAPDGYAGLVGGLEPIGVAPADVGVTLRPGMTMAEIERAAIESALRNTRGNRRKAAEVLQIGERTLYRKLREYHLVPDEEGEAGVADGASRDAGARSDAGATSDAGDGTDASGT
ncbi:MAG: sigma-54-dependent Fis family transcriptional regulator [Gemmatimonadaceae bacterium]|nr:sigma-54-dependent Fis family transcriptional regulator [Gemmatimonadaceae bacterium]